MKNQTLRKRKSTAKNCSSFTSQLPKVEICLLLCEGNLPRSNACNLNIKTELKIGKSRKIISWELIGKLFSICQLLDEKDRIRILGPHKKVQQWVENTKTATSPCFDEVHNVLFKAKARFQEQRAKSGSSSKTNLPSKM